MNDDFNTPVLIAQLFEAVRIINSAANNKEQLNADDIQLLKKIYQHFLVDVLGLQAELENDKSREALNGVMNYLISLRNDAKQRKDFPASDAIRNHLNSIGIQIKDNKESSTWTFQ